MKKLKMSAILGSVIVFCGAMFCQSVQSQDKEKAEPAGKENTAATVTKTEVKADAAKAKDAEKESDIPLKENPLDFLPPIVVKMGDENITKEQVMEEVKPLINMIKKNDKKSYANDKLWHSLAKEVVDELVDRTILLKLASADGFKPSAEAAEKEFQNMQKEIPAEKIEELLAQQGLTMDDFKKKMAIGVAIRDWINKKVTSSIKDEDIEKYYRENQDKYKKAETVNASHILINPKEIDKEKSAKMTEEEKKTEMDKAKADAKKKAEDILAKLKTGGDFEKLAEENSACPSGKSSKGNLGEFQRGAMVKEFDDAAFGLKPGEISGVVETKFGYHIIKLNSKKEAGLAPLEEAKESIKKNLVNDKLRNLVEKEREKVEILLPVEPVEAGEPVGKEGKTE